MTKSLRLIDTFRLAMGHLWAERKIIGGLLAVVVSFDVALEWLQPALADENENTGWFVFVFTLQALVYTWFAVRVHRLILGVANPVQGMVRWKTRETRFFAWLTAGVMFLLIVGAVLVFTLLRAVAVVVHGDDLDDRVIAVVLALALLPAAYLLARFAVLLPAIAIDQKRNIAWAWALTKGNGWRLMLILWGLPTILVSALAVSAFAALSLEAWFNSLFGSLVLNGVFGIATAIEVALLSVAFKTLAGAVWVQPVGLVEQA